MYSVQRVQSLECDKRLFGILKTISETTICLSSHVPSLPHLSFSHKIINFIKSLSHEHSYVNLSPQALHFSFSKVAGFYGLFIGLQCGHR